MAAEIVMVSVGSDILELPLWAFATKGQRRWLCQPRSSGDDPVLAAKAKLGWEMYSALVRPKRAQKVIPILKRDKFRFWLRCKLVKWGII